MNNVLVEWLMQSVKCQQLYLCAYRLVSEVGQGLQGDLASCTARRLHATQDCKTTDALCFGSLMP
jgi:hypothetical protein